MPAVSITADLEWDMLGNWDCDGCAFSRRQHSLFLCLLAFTFIQLSFLQCALGGDGMSVLFMAAHASITRSQHLLHPQDSAFAALYWKEMLL